MSCLAQNALLILHHAFPTINCFLWNILEYKNGFLGIAILPTTYILSKEFYPCWLDFHMLHNFPWNLGLLVHLLEVVKSQYCQLTFLQNKTPLAQIMWNFLSFPTNMLKNKCKILHILYPFEMFQIQLLMCGDKISVYRKKLLWYQIRPPFLQCLYDNIKFFIIRWVFFLASFNFSLK